MIEVILNKDKFKILKVCTLLNHILLSIFIYITMPKDKPGGQHHKHHYQFRVSEDTCYLLCKFKLICVNLRLHLGSLTRVIKKAKSVSRIKRSD